MPLPAYLFVSESDGALYDTRVPEWFKNPPLRPVYRRGFRGINSVAELKAALRYGRYTDIGCYPLYFLASDGEAMSFGAVRDNFREVASAIQSHDNSGWRVVACDTNYEDGELYCAHTGEHIESAMARESE